MTHQKTVVASIAAACLWLATASSHAQALEGNAVERIQVTGQKDPSNWIRVESQHVIVYSNAGGDAAAQLLNNLERLDHVLRIYAAPFMKPGGAQKIAFYYVAREADLQRIAGAYPKDGVGMYASCTAGVQGVGVELEPLAQPARAELAKGALNDSQAHLFAAYARHFLYRYTDVRKPDWFVEGFAQYFSSARFTDDRLALGRTPAAMGRYLHFLDEGNRYSLDWPEVLAGAMPGPDTRVRNYAGPAGVQLEFEARAWLLTHYAMSTPANRARLLRYLDRVAHGTASGAAFEDSFGIKVQDLGTAMWRYRLPGVRVEEVDMPALPRATLDTTVLGRTAGTAVWADAALRACPGPKAGKALLQALNEAGPGRSEFARLALSRAQVDWGNPQDALPYLESVVRADKDHAEALYLLGLANLRLAGGPQDGGDPTQRAARLAAAHRALLAAVQLRPQAPDAALALLRSEIALKTVDTDTLARVTAAWQGTRETGALARSAALVYVAQGSYDKAAIVLRILANNDRDPALAAWAGRWQRTLASKPGPQAAFDELAADPRDEQAFREWTIDGASVMQVVEYNAGLDKARSIIDQQVQNPDPSKALLTPPTAK